MTQRVLLLGGGGREHAIAWKLAQSPHLGALWAGPGNAGTATIAEASGGAHLPTLDAGDPAAVVAAAQELRADLVIVGPEGPLAAGVVDALQQHDIAAFGPSRTAAQIEASKAFAKDLMGAAGIETAQAQTFSDAAAAQAHVRALGGPVVVKADGLAAGKGAVVCDDPEQACAAIDQMMRDRAFGAAGDRVVIEERMTGPETSAHAFTDGETVRHMPFSCDHKPVWDGDLGPNTGGMGAYTPPDWLTAQQSRAIEQRVTERAVAAMTQAGAPYRGVLFPGIMMTPSGVRVVEFNCRFGDPEAEVLLPRLRSDLLDICTAVATGRLAEVPVEWDSGATVGVVMASAGYPGKYEVGLPISGLDVPDTDTVQVFHAGVQRDQQGHPVTAGGRVLCVVARGATIAQARERAYTRVSDISFAGAHYRTDIASPERIAAAAAAAI